MSIFWPDDEIIEWNHKTDPTYNKLTSNYFLALLQHLGVVEFRIPYDHVWDGSFN